MDTTVSTLPKYLATTLFAVSLLTTTATSRAMPVNITITVNGNSAVEIADEPLDESSGYFLYIGEYIDPNGDWTASWNYWINPDPHDGAAFLGTAEVKNTSGDVADFVLEVEVPLCPVIEGQSLLGAFLVVRINTNADGGTMTDFDGEPIWSVMSDGEVARSLFDPPFLLGSSGQGTASLSNQFGAPFPSEPSIPFQHSATIRHQFSMTDGDVGRFNTSLYIGAESEYLADCDDDQHPNGDLNMDGIVDGADLLILIAQWGECRDSSDCPADLNGDGVVDGTDLIILVSNWG